MSQTVLQGVDLLDFWVENGHRIDDNQWCLRKQILDDSLFQERKEAWMDRLTYHRSCNIMYIVGYDSRFLQPLLSGMDLCLETRDMSGFALGLRVIDSAMNIARAKTWGADKTWGAEFEEGMKVILKKYVSGEFLKDPEVLRIFKEILDPVGSIPSVFSLNDSSLHIVRRKGKDMFEFWLDGGFDDYILHSRNSWSIWVWTVIFCGVANGVAKKPVHLDIEPVVNLDFDTGLNRNNNLFIQKYVLKHLKCGLDEKHLKSMFHILAGDYASFFIGMENDDLLLKFWPLSAIMSSLQDNRNVILNDILPCLYGGIHVNGDPNLCLILLEAKEFFPPEEMLLLFRMVFRSGCARFFVVPCDSDPIWEESAAEKVIVYMTKDWCVTNSMKRTRREKLQESMKPLVDHAHNYYESGGSQFGGYVVVCNDGTAKFLDFGVVRDCILSDKEEKRLSANCLLMIERRVNFPTRTWTEVQLVMTALTREIEDSSLKETNLYFRQHMKNFLGRWTEPIKKSQQHFVLSNFVESLLKLVSKYIDASGHFPSVLCSLNILNTFLGSFESKKIREILHETLERKLYYCLNVNWEDVQECCLNLIEKFALPPSDLRSRLKFVHILLTSPKSRDFKTGEAWFSLVAKWFYSGDFDGNQTEVFLDSLMKAPVIHSSPLEALLHFIITRGEEAPHSYLKCLSVLLDYDKNVVTMEKLVYIFQNIIKPTVKTVLDIISSCDQQIFLNNPPKGSSTQMDCRGHLVGSDDDPSIFSRYWLTIKNCGEILTKLFSYSKLDHEIDFETFRLCVNDSVEILLGSRHPGLLQKWSDAITMGIERACSLATKNPKWGYIPVELTLKLVNSLYLDPSAANEVVKNDNQYLPKHFEILLKDLADARTFCIKQDRSIVFKYIPPPLRKSATLSSALISLLPIKLFKRPKEYHIADFSLERISHSDFALVIISELVVRAAQIGHSEAGK